MKKLLAVSIFLFSGYAMADHSLADAMMDSSAVDTAVHDIEEKNNVTCKVSESVQDDYQPNDGTAWQQTAQCYDENGVLKGEIVVAYSYEDYKANKVLDAKYIAAP